jgi:hypothetical protein
MRFAGSVDTFVYEDKNFRPTWKPNRGYRLTAEHRRQLCVHLAAHAVVSHLGGLDVYMLAVAGEGVRSWSIGDRKSNAGMKMWGRCSTSDIFCPDARWYDDDDYDMIKTDPASWESGIDRNFTDYLARVEAARAGGREELPVSRDEYFELRRRDVRAHICGHLAGHIADGITASMSADEVLQLCDRRDTQRVGASDIVVARGLADLLSAPFDEYDHAVRLTGDMLRRAEVWSSVQRLAAELGRFGLLEGSPSEVSIFDFLAKPEGEWPPAMGTPS